MDLLYLIEKVSKNVISSDCSKYVQSQQHKQLKFNDDGQTFACIVRNAYKVECVNNQRKETLNLGLKEAALPSA